MSKEDLRKTGGLASDVEGLERVKQLELKYQRLVKKGKMKIIKEKIEKGYRIKYISKDNCKEK